MIKVKKNVVPEIKPIRMGCDHPLSPHLNNTPLLALNNHTGCIWAVLGKPMSGKTTKVLEFLNSADIFKGVFENIFFIIPPNSRKSARKFFDKYDEELEDNCYDECNVQNLLDIERRIDESANTTDVDENGKPCLYKSLLIVDDCQSVFKHADIMTVLGRLVLNRRHTQTNLMLLCQNYISMPTNIRSALSGIMIFKPSLRDWGGICREFIPRDFNEMVAVYKYCFGANHHLGDFLFYHFGSARMFRNFDELLFNDD